MADTDASVYKRQFAVVAAPDGASFSFLYSQVDLPSGSQPSQVLSKGTEDKSESA